MDEPRPLGGSTVTPSPKRLGAARGIIIAIGLATIFWIAVALFIWV